MPLIVISGIPSSGKTKRALQIKHYFEEEHKKPVQIVSEIEAITNAGFEKNAFYLDSQKEKHVRGVLKSEVMRHIGKDNIVILDSGNYIKGFRYELYCGSKASKTTQCTIFTIINIEQAWDFNAKRSTTDSTNDKKKCGDENFNGNNSNDLNNLPYTREVFDALVLRFEEPNSQSRWDSPLMVVGCDDELPLKDIHAVLYNRAPPPPNLSTQNPPLSSTNFLFDLDKVTQEICARITSHVRECPGSEVRFPEYPGKIISAEAVQDATPAKILRLRRQFISYARMNHSTLDVSVIAGLFVQYLNSTLQE